MFDLPPNVPKSPDHWIGRYLPNGHRISSMEEVILLMANHQANKSLFFNPSNPMGPLPRQPGSGQPELMCEAEALQIFQNIPEDD